MATSGAGGALHRVARRVMRAVELVVLAVGLRWCFLNLPCATAAAVSSVLRVAASFAVQRYFFLAANAFVIVLLAVCHRDVASYSLPPAALFGWWSPDSDAQDQYLLFPGPPLMLPPPITEAGEEEKAAVFEDKEAVHVTTVRAQPPRRSRSEKTAAGGGAAGRTRAAAPELRRAESENGRQRQQAAPEVPPVPVEWGMDEEAFRLSIEAFILKQQTSFQREESVILKQQTSFQLKKPDAVAAAGRDDAPVIAGAVVAVK